MAPPLVGKNGKVTIVFSQLGDRATQDLEVRGDCDWLRGLSLERYAPLRGGAAERSRATSRQPTTRRRSSPTHRQAIWPVIGGMEDIHRSKSAFASTIARWFPATMRTSDHPPRGLVPPAGDAMSLGTL